MAKRAKYRIVKVFDPFDSNNPFRVEQRFFGFIWGCIGAFKSLELAKEFTNRCMMKKARKIIEEF